MPARRPAFIGATSFVAGTLGGIHWGDAHRGAWAALAVLLPLALLLRPHRARLWLRCGACLFLGWALATRPGERLRACRARLEAATGTGERLTVRGEVAGVPRQVPASRGETCHRFTLTRLELVEHGRRAPLFGPRPLSRGHRVNPDTLNSSIRPMMSPSRTMSYAIQSAFMSPFLS